MNNIRVVCNCLCHFRYIIRMTHVEISIPAFQLESHFIDNLKY